MVDFLLSLVVLAAHDALVRHRPDRERPVRCRCLPDLAMLLALAFGLWLGPINVRFRDIKHRCPS